MPVALRYVVVALVRALFGAGNLVSRFTVVGEGSVAWSEVRQFAPAFIVGGAKATESVTDEVILDDLLDGHPTFSFPGTPSRKTDCFLRFGWHTTTVAPRREERRRRRKRPLGGIFVTDTVIVFFFIVST
jgi:hypothetical protein